MPSPADDPRLMPGLIVFGRDTGTGGKFFTIRPDGSDERFLVDDAGGCLMCGEWSPDGSRMMFAAMTADGRVTTATVRPDGTALFVLPIADPTPSCPRLVGAGRTACGLRWLGRDGSQAAGRLYRCRRRQRHSAPRHR